MKLKNVLIGGMVLLSLSVSISGCDLLQWMDPNDDSSSKKPPYAIPTKPLDILDGSTAEEFESSDGSILKYRLFLPDGYNTDNEYPVLVFLHGAGERGDDNQLQLKNAVQILYNDIQSPIYGAIVIAPQCPLNQQWVDVPFGQGNYSVNSIPESNELASVVELCESFKTTYSVDEDRFYAMGISMGGYGTWDLLTRHGDLFAAGVPICGAGDVAQATQLATKSIWAFHGTNDPSVPFAGTKNMIDALQVANATSVKYEYYEGAGHNIWDTVAENKEVMKWLFDQTY